MIDTLCRICGAAEWVVGGVCMHCAITTREKERTDMSLQAELDEIFRLARVAQEFPDDFAAGDIYEKFLLFFANHSNEALDVFLATAQSTEDTETVSEALRAMGHVEDKPSHERRLEILMDFLAAPSPRVRYGALMGLDNLRDAKAVPAIERARKAEKVEMLNGLYKQVLERLAR